MEPEIYGTISISMKVNLGNYESAEAFMSLSGINELTTEDQINSLLDGKMKISYDALKLRMAEKIKSIRQGG